MSLMGDANSQSVPALGLIAVTERFQRESDLPQVANRPKNERRRNGVIRSCKILMMTTARCPDQVYVDRFKKRQGTGVRVDRAAVRKASYATSRSSRFLCEASHLRARIVETAKKMQNAREYPTARTVISQTSTGSML